MIENLFRKVIVKNFLNLEKVMDMLYEVERILNRLDKYFYVL